MSKANILQRWGGRASLVFRNICCSLQKTTAHTGEPINSCHSAAEDLIPLSGLHPSSHPSLPHNNHTHLHTHTHTHLHTHIHRCTHSKLKRSVCSFTVWEQGNKRQGTIPGAENSPHQAPDPSSTCILDLTDFRNTKKRKVFSTLCLSHLCPAYTKALGRCQVFLPRELSCFPSQGTTSRQTKVEKYLPFPIFVKCMTRENEGTLRPTWDCEWTEPPINLHSWLQWKGRRDAAGSTNTIHYFFRRCGPLSSLSPSLNFFF